MAIDKKSTRPAPSLSQFMTNQFSLLSDNCAGGTDINNPRKEGDQLNDNPKNVGTIPKIRNSKNTMGTNKGRPSPLRANRRLPTFNITTGGAPSSMLESNISEPTFEEKLNQLLYNAKKQDNAKKRDDLARTKEAYLARGEWGPPPLSYTDVSRRFNKPLTPHEIEQIKAANQAGVIPNRNTLQQFKKQENHSNQSQIDNTKTQTQESSYRNNNIQQQRAPPPPTQIPPESRTRTQELSYAAATMQRPVSAATVQQRLPTKFDQPMCYNYETYEDDQWPHETRHAVLFPLPNGWTVEEYVQALEKVCGPGAIVSYSKHYKVKAYFCFINNEWAVYFLNNGVTINGYDVWPVPYKMSSTGIELCVSAVPMNVPNAVLLRHIQSFCVTAGHFEMEKIYMRPSAPIVAGLPQRFRRRLHMVSMKRNISIQEPTQVIPSTLRINLNDESVLVHLTVRRLEDERAERRKRYEQRTAQKQQASEKSQQQVPKTNNSATKTSETPGTVPNTLRTENPNPTQTSSDVAQTNEQAPEIEDSSSQNISQKSFANGFTGFDASQINIPGLDNMQNLENELTKEEQYFLYVHDVSPALFARKFPRIIANLPPTRELGSIPRIMDKYKDGDFDIIRMHCESSGIQDVIPQSAEDIYLNQASTSAEGMDFQLGSSKRKDLPSSDTTETESDPESIDTTVSIESDSTVTGSKEKRNHRRGKKEKRSKENISTTITTPGKEKFESSTTQPDPFSTKENNMETPVSENVIPNLTSMGNITQLNPFQTKENSIDIFNLENDIPDSASNLNTNNKASASTHFESSNPSINLGSSTELHKEKLSLDARDLEEITSDVKSQQQYEVPATQSGAGLSIPDPTPNDLVRVQIKDHPPDQAKLPLSVTPVKQPTIVLTPVGASASAEISSKDDLIVNLPGIAGHMGSITIPLCKDALVPPSPPQDPIPPVKPPPTMLAVETMEVSREDSFSTPPNSPHFSSTSVPPSLSSSGSPPPFLDDDQIDFFYRVFNALKGYSPPSTAHLSSFEIACVMSAHNNVESLSTCLACLPYEDSDLVSQLQALYASTFFKRSLQSQLHRTIKAIKDMFNL